MRNVIPSSNRRAGRRSLPNRLSNSPRFSRVFDSGASHGQKDCQIRLDLAVYLTVNHLADKKTDKSAQICPCICPREDSRYERHLSLPFTLPLFPKCGNEMVMATVITNPLPFFSDFGRVNGNRRMQARRKHPPSHAASLHRAIIKEIEILIRNVVGRTGRVQHRCYIPRMDIHIEFIEITTLVEVSDLTRVMYIGP